MSASPQPVQASPAAALDLCAHVSASHEVAQLAERGWLDCSHWPESRCCIHLYPERLPAVCMPADAFAAVTNGIGVLGTADGASC